MDMPINKEQMEQTETDDGSMIMGNGAGMKMKKMMMMMMNNYKSFNTDTSMNFLFEHVHINTVEGIILAMLLTMILAFLFECATLFIAVKMKTLQNVKNKRSTAISTLAVISILKMSTTFIGYILMLCVMTYNIWLLSSVVLASGIGHFIIRPVLLPWLRRHVSVRSESAANIDQLEPLHDFAVETNQSDINV